MGIDFFANLRADPDAALWLEGLLGQSIRLQLLSSEPLNNTLICSGDLPTVMPKTIDTKGTTTLRVDGEKGHWKISVLIGAIHLERQTIRLTVRGEPTALPRRQHFRLNNPGVQTGIRPEGQEQAPYVSAKAKNISEGGTAVLVPHGAYQVDQRLDVKIQLGDGFIFNTGAKIVNIPPKSGEPGQTLLCLQFNELPKMVSGKVSRYIIQKEQSRRKLSR